ncbi:MAG: helix-turn-helix transcriptional regulator [Spirochaetes bacterium]|nr:helix-turn-helix transcriptional regulator [Spirochaetota bacterium]
MSFPKTLIMLRKKKGMTQKTLANLVGLHVVQIQRYENATCQPTLDVIRKLAVTFSVTTDTLIFDKDERGPDDDLRLQFEAICKFDSKEKMIIKEVIDALILKYEAKRWISS